MHWLPYKVQQQLLLNRRHVFPGFLLIAGGLVRLSCFHPRTGTSDLGRRNRGHFTTHFLKLLGLLGIWSWAAVQELIQIWLSAFFWRNQGVPSLRFWTSVGVRSISKSIFNKHWTGEGWKQFWEVLMTSCFLLIPFPHLPAWMLQAGSTVGTGWRGCCSYNSMQRTGRTVQGPGAEGLQKQLAGWTDLIELTLPSFPALTFAEGCHLLPVLPLGGGMLQSCWVGAPWARHGLREGKEELRGGWDSMADETRHRGWPQWICSMHLVLQVRLKVTWPVTVPHRQSRSFVLLPSGSNQPPVLFFKCMSQDSKAL